jgi:hypothetical protein
MQVAEDWLYDESAEQIVLFTKNVCCCNCTMQVAEDWLYDKSAEQMVLFTRIVCAVPAQCR